MFSFIQEIEEREKGLKSKEQGLGKSLYQPFTDANSGARKLMAATQLEHAMPLFHPEIACVKTGYEERYGDYSSAIIKADAPYEVVGKISKFTEKPNHHYWLLVRNLITNSLGVIERVSYNYSTEAYGYLYKNDTLDQLDIGYEIQKDEILRTSTSVDNYGNRMDGVNLTMIYQCNEITKEDGMLISESAQKKLASPLFKRVTIMLNDNDMFLNLMGTPDEYKSFPHIGEEVSNGILCAIRREQSDTALFTQSIENLAHPLMSDDKYTVGDGEVIDLTIKCNNPDILADKYTNSELLYYYNDWVRCMKEIVSTVNWAVDRFNITKLEYDLEKLYVNCKRELRGDQFIDGEKIFSGTVIEFMVMERNLPNIGDKITNRYGGKGVIAKIRPDELMPRDAITGQVIDMMMNGCTCVNRTNAGQAHEVSIMHINTFLVDFFRTNCLSTAEIMQEVIKLISFISVEEAVCLSDYFNHLDPEDKDMFVQQILDDGYVQISTKPISESITQDKLAEIYDEFPYIHQKPLLVAQKNSKGTYRYVYSRRPVTIGTMYIYRLKQYAEEKFSVTSLSSSNIRGENSRNKLNKNYKALYPATPIQFGYMEADEFGHLGFETIIETMMIHSLSPQARKLVEKIYTDDPYEIDIKLDSDSKNRSAEQVAVYLKAIGYELFFRKIKKVKKVPFKRAPFIIQHPTKLPFKIIHPDENFDYNKWMEFMAEQEDKKKAHPFTIAPFMIEKKK